MENKEFHAHIDPVKAGRIGKTQFTQDQTPANSNHRDSLKLFLLTCCCFTTDAIFNDTRWTQGQNVIIKTDQISFHI